MRPNSIKTILMAASVALASTAVAQTTTLTLDDAVRIALSDNPTVKVADSEITKQEYAKKGTLANLMPTLDFSAGYNRTLKKQVMYMGDMKGFGGGSSEGTEGHGSRIGDARRHQGGNGQYVVGRLRAFVATCQRPTVETAEHLCRRC